MKTLLISSCVHRSAFWCLSLVVGGPQAYTLYGAEIGGDKLVNGFIALTVLVKTSDVAQGAFHVQEGALSKVAAGVSNLDSIHHISGLKKRAAPETGWRSEHPIPLSIYI